MSVSYGGDSITFADGSVQSGGWTGFRNRIINGGMAIDQRNAGAAVTSSGSFAVDRWFFNNVSDGTLSVQQSTDVPSGSGFKYSLKMTATVGDGTIGASQYCNLQHRIEGFNFADTGFGASGASAVTLSFWVKATVAGNYSVALYNSAENRVNPQQFTVLASNTWEQKTITYTGDTTGTWLTTNGIGANVTFYPALGSNFVGSAGWNTGGIFGVSGQSNAIASNGNIFAITGVQLERGSTASSFEYRPYGTELILCQRYFEKTYEQTVAIGTATENGWEWIGSDCPNLTTTGTLQSQRPRFSVTKRTQPIMTVWDASGNTGKATRYYVGSGPSSNHTCTTDLITVNSFRVFVAGTTTTTNGAFHWAANAEF